MSVSMLSCGGLGRTAIERCIEMGRDLGRELLDGAMDIE
jgi:hypothetical protein